MSTSESATMPVERVPRTPAYFQPAGDIATEYRSQERWVIKHLLSRDLSLLIGMDGVGKSALVAVLAEALVRGAEHIGGLEIERADYRVGIVVGSIGDLVETARRLQAIGTDAAKSVLLEQADTSRTDDPDYWQEIADRLKESGEGTPVLFVDDVYGLAWKGADMSIGPSGPLLLSCLRELADQGIAVVLVHPAQKPTKATISPLGHRAFASLPSIVVALEDDQEVVMGTGKKRLTVWKSNRGPSGFVRQVKLTTRDNVPHLQGGITDPPF